MKERLVYIVTVPSDMGGGKETLYFSTPKKVHTFLREQKLPVMKRFTDFKKWLTQDGYYEIGVKGDMVTTAQLL